MDVERRQNKNRNVDSIELTEQERKVLRECRMNSMVRGVPAGILSVILTSFAVRSGRFPHMTHWSRLYYGASFTGGLLFGVASYRKTCLEKIMKLENSALADQVREYYKRSGMEYIGPQQQRKDSEFDESAAATTNSSTEDHETELSKENTAYSSRLQDEDKSSSMDKHKSDDTKPKLSFEDRRRQHRQQWNMDQYPPVRTTRKVEDKNQPSHDSDHNMPAASSDSNQGSSGSIRRNIYGDPIE